jgi:hypothetical protein
MKKINLYETYRKVKQRIKRSSGLQKENAEAASEAAKQILKHPNLKSVATFRKLEHKWLQSSNGNSVAIADEFHNAIQTNNYEIKITYSSHKTNWNPKTGYLYCFASQEYPGIVKIGATESSITRRVNDYKRRRNLNHLKIVFAIKVENPSLKETKLHDLLRKYKVYPDKIPKSNEWFRITQKYAKTLIASMAD